MTSRIERTIENAIRIEADFIARSRDVAPHPRGITLSEALFVYATALDASPRQVVESGRAAGVSTELLSRCFAPTPIVSVDTDINHPDSVAAFERFRKTPNISALFGDARVLLPELTLPGDVVLLDGPKELRALKLGYRLLARNDAAMVFIHDCFPGSRIRAYLDKHVKASFFSDHPAYARRFGHLDADRIGDDASDPGVMGCVTAAPGFPSLLRRLHVTLARMVRR